MKPAALGPNRNLKGRSKFGTLFTEIWKNRMVYTLLLPGLIWLLIFAYLPMGGLSLAFKDYKANLGIWGSPWVGFENFKYVFRDPAFIDALWRTLYINIIKLFIQFPFPILLALMLNELRMRRAKKLFQTVFTFPHFLSWIIVSGVVINVLAYDGLVNSALALLGLPTINFLGSESTFVPMLLLTDIWKSTGWGAIIYLAAISGIDQDQYESSQIDGATRLQQMFQITLPNILPTVTIMFILSVGGLMSSGFDQIFNLANAATKNVSEVLDVYIYRITFQSSTDFSFSTAVSLFRSLVNMILLLLADRVAKMLGGDGLFR
ncbi:ABC transporter permease [Paenibacillus apiarius]|uniref:ABC transporter permease subunit n=1 Tax=Paenibacillus apiarius TaxID=46240 RepID=A0ABT4DZE6_9BACL|nr:ABC transporter permease subunit [Paenibacillus apiarius]MBN3524978.1 sugar ABC transporter permease [Paenibacillus apiarius]MCY9515170.1 ABC transporter permease subunit [Paenibacillus apiarius]MCY9522729.1 ABC transporter permease subunit [Paenibacillus apiarius]MCY9552949.1 ABC transporter permease subunit [Paenibacillus apiarius]MCY9557634.1 ABC transporter permease subunit [Paenibacillus apiarius]